jgi:alkyldihydroxyacetonephosphate synthase
MESIDGPPGIPVNRQQSAVVCNWGFPIKVFVGRLANLSLGRGREIYGVRDRGATPAMDPESLRRKLSTRLDPKRVLVGDRIPERYRLDALRPHRGGRMEEAGEAPAAVVFPVSTAEVSASVAVAGGVGCSIVAWGGGTGLMGGARPTRDSVVIDLRRMRRVRAIDAPSRTATAEAGIVLEDLDRALRRRKMSLGHDPWSRPRATLDGAIATNGLGYAGYVRGSMGDQVLGLVAVLADGTVLRTRAAARSTTGLDLKRLFIGTEGTLGLVTAATIRAFPLPDREDLRAFRVPDFERGFEAVCGIYDDGL